MDFTWDNDTFFGSWEDENSWYPPAGYPNSYSDNAILASGGFNPITRNVTIGMYQNTVISSLICNNSIYSYTVFQENYSTTHLFFGEAGITLLAGTHTINGLIDTQNSSTPLNIQGNGTLILKYPDLVFPVPNGYSADTAIHGGTLQAGMANIFSPNSNFVVDFGSHLSLGDTNGYFSNTIGMLNGGGTVQLGTASLTVLNGGSYAGSIIDTSSGSLTLAGGTLFLAGTNTYSGGTMIDLGASIKFIEAGSLLPTGSVLSNGEFDISIATTAATIGNLSGSGIVQVGTNTLNINPTSNCSFSGQIVGGSGGALIKGGNQILILSGINVYSLSTEINGGVLQANSTTALSPYSSYVVNGTLSLGTGPYYSNTIGSLSGSGNLSFGTADLTILHGNGNTFSGIAAGSGSLILDEGVLSLSNANSYTGGTVINSGAVLNLTLAGAIAPSGNVNANGTFSIANISGNSLTIADLIGEGAVSLGAKNLTFGTSTPSAQFSGDISGLGGSITKNGSGTVIFSGTNSYSGATTIASGTMRAGSNQALSPSSDFTLTGTLDLNGFNNTIKSLSGSGSVSLSTASLTILNGGNFLGGINGSGGLLLTGGQLILSNSANANNYSGNTTLNSGVSLIAGANHAFSFASPFILDGSAIVNLNGFNNTILSLDSDSPNAALILGAGTLTLNSGATTSFAGSITNGPCGGITIDGGYNFTLSGISNTYCGDTTIANGTLNIVQAGALSLNTNVIIDSLGTLNVSAANSAMGLTNMGTVSNSSALSLMSLESSSEFTNIGTAFFHTANISGGTLTNAHIGTQALFQGMGILPSILVSGGSVVNGTTASPDTSLMGNFSTSFSFSSGTITNNSRIQSSVYEQSSGATYNSIFSTGSGTQFGTVAAKGNITLAGTLNAIKDASFTQPTTESFTLMSTTAPGVIAGGFNSENASGFFPAPRFAQSLRALSMYFGSCDGNWVNLSSGNWGLGANWAGCDPGEAGNQNDAASFSNFGGSLTNDIIVTLADSTGSSPQPITLYLMNFGMTGNPNFNYTIQKLSSSSTLTFNSESSEGSQPPAIMTVTSGAPMIQAPIVLATDTELLLADGARMTFGSDTTISSIGDQVFTVANYNNAPLGTGTLINMATLNPAQFIVDSATVENNGSIQITGSIATEGIFSVTSAQISGSALNAYFNNNAIHAVAGTTADGAEMILGGLGNTTVENSASSTTLSCTGDKSFIDIGSSYTAPLRGITTILNTGTGAKIEMSGTDSIFVISGDGVTSVYNTGVGAFLGISGVNGSFVIEGDTSSSITGGVTAVYNRSVGTIMGATGTGGQASFVGGTLFNEGGATFKTGPGGSISIEGGIIYNREGASVEADSIVISGGFVNNDLSSFFGTATSNLTFSGGVLETAGTILASSYTQSGDSTLVLDMSSSKISGNIQATGVAELNSTLVLKAAHGSTFSPGDTVNLVEASRGIQGTFQTVDFLNFPSFIIPQIQYSDTLVQLTCASTLTPMPIGSIPNLNIANISEINFRIERNIYSIHKRMMDKQRNKGDNLEVVAAADVAVQEKIERNIYQASRRSEEIPWRIYAGPIGSFGHYQGLGAHQVGFGIRSAGVFSGFDYTGEYGGVGIAFEYANLSGVCQKHAGHFDGNFLHGAAYGAITIPSRTDLVLYMIGGCGYDWLQLYRKAGPISNPLIAFGKPVELEYDLTAGAEFSFSEAYFRKIPSNLIITPFLNFQFVWDHFGRYYEKRAGAYDLSYKSQITTSLQSLFGTRIDYLFVSEPISLNAELDLAWNFECLDLKKSLLISTIRAPISAHLNETVFSPSKSTLWIGVDFLITLYRHFQIEASVDLQWNSRFFQNSYYLGVGAEF